jgi:hypothetical protein
MLTSTHSDASSPFFTVTVPSGRRKVLEALGDCRTRSSTFWTAGLSVVTLPSGRRSPTAPWSTLNARSLACSLVIRFFARASLIRLSWRCVSEARNRC